MATDKEEKRQNLINRILGTLGKPSDFGQDFGEAFNLGSEDVMLCIQGVKLNASRGKRCLITIRDASQWLS